MPEGSGGASLSLSERRRLSFYGDEGKVAVGKRLQAVRLAFGLTAEHLADACFCDAKHVLDSEAGKIMPPSGVILYFWNRWKIPDEFILEGRKIDLIPAASFEPRIFALLSRL